ncbi:MAG: hypothetical protein R3175_07535 [Marinobacter sp.]|uniref:hypothetical protein n=1 Tax=Marinobacter sp. TaxID=50741 RepID=UPI00299DD0AE|nr:hypothetical protein [Marinobacter sp.]MDX1755892.1 hypothetical protein [Marinobacter sp.]
MSVSLVMIVPASLLDDANATGLALGVGPENFTVALSSDGSTVTHYGALHQLAQPEFVQMLADAEGGTLPPITWEDHGLTEARVQAVVDALIADVSSEYSRPGDHFTAVLASNNLEVLHG